MEAKTIESLTRIAGIGGLGIAALIIVFKLILRLNIFQKLNQGQTYSILNQVLRMVFVVTILSLVVWAISSKRHTDSIKNSSDSSSATNLNSSMQISNSGNIGNISNGNNNQINNNIVDSTSNTK